MAGGRGYPHGCPWATVGSNPTGATPSGRAAPAASPDPGGFADGEAEESQRLGLPGRWVESDRGYSMRLFVGMPAPPLPEFSACTAAILAGIPGSRAVPDGAWHVTLRFMGDVEDPTAAIAALRKRLSDARASPGQVVGVGAFPDRRRARILWAGVLAPGIDAIARRVVSATAEFGEPPERHDFVPHITLARLRDGRDVTKFLSEKAGVSFGLAPFDEVVLFRSALRPGGPEYEPLETFKLRPQASSPPSGSA